MFEHNAFAACCDDTPLLSLGLGVWVRLHKEEVRPKRRLTDCAHVLVEATAGLGLHVAGCVAAERGAGLGAHNRVKGVACLARLDKVVPTVAALDHGAKSVGGDHEHTLGGVIESAVAIRGAELVPELLGVDGVVDGRADVGLPEVEGIFVADDSLERLLGRRGDVVGHLPQLEDIIELCDVLDLLLEVLVPFLLIDDLDSVFKGLDDVLHEDCLELLLGLLLLPSDLFEDAIILDSLVEIVELFDASNLISGAEIVAQIFDPLDELGVFTLVAT